MVYVSPPTYEISSVEYVRGVEAPLYSRGEERVSSSPRAGQRRLRETNPPTSRDRAVHKEYEIRESLEKTYERARQDVIEMLLEPKQSEELLQFLQFFFGVTPSLLAEKREIILEKMGEIYSPNGDSDELLASCYFLALLLGSGEKYEEAVAVLEPIYNKRSDTEGILDKELTQGLAFLHFYLGNKEEAAKYLMLAEFPSGGEVLQGVAALWLGDRESAKKAFSENCYDHFDPIDALFLKVIGEDPVVEKGDTPLEDDEEEDKDSYLRRGEYDTLIASKKKPSSYRAAAFALKGDCEEALADYAILIEKAKGSKSVYFYYERGLVYLLMGNKEAALSDFRHAALLEKKWLSREFMNGVYAIPMGSFLVDWVQEAYFCNESATAPTPFSECREFLEKKRCEAIATAEILCDKAELERIRESDRLIYDESSIQLLYCSCSLYGQLLLHTGHFKEALAVLEPLYEKYAQIIELEPNFSSFLEEMELEEAVVSAGILANAYFGLGDVKRTVEHLSLECPSIRENCAGARIMHGIAQLVLGDPAKTREILSQETYYYVPMVVLLLQASGQSPLYSPKNFIWGDRYLLASGRYEKITGEEAPYKAAALALQEQYEESLLQYTRLIEGYTVKNEDISYYSEHSLEDYYIERGLVHLLHGDREAALKDLSAAKSIEKDNYEKYGFQKYGSLPGVLFGVGNYTTISKAALLLEWIESTFPSDQ